MFSPLAWMKLQLFLHAGETEVGGFGVSAEDNVLYVHDFVTLRQYTTRSPLSSTMQRWLNTSIDAWIRA